MTCYSVSQVTAYIKDLLQQDDSLNSILIRGEVSNCKYHSSGHIYFTLKDAGAQLPCVMFSGYRRGLTYKMENGDQIQATGSIGVYEQGGRYQLYVTRIVPDGAGALAASFQRLKKELEAAGYFDKAHKKPIPFYAAKIGIVTARTGAALQDMIHIAARRNPYAQLILCPALVQGEGAAASIASAIARLDKMNLDVLVVGRGGGSLEDLWAFNEKIVADAIYQCRTPVISAVGHETDVTISDFVADLRAPTPSAAMELAVCDIQQVFDRLAGYQKRLEHAGPAQRLSDYRQRLVDADDKLRLRMSMRLLSAKHRLELLSGRLEAISPRKRLQGSYAFVEKEDGTGCGGVSGLLGGDKITLFFQDGTARASVEQVELY